MKFGEKVRKLRRERGLIQQELADILGVSVRTIKNYESGNSYPKKRDIYKKLADYFNVNINYFLTEDENFIIQANNQYGYHGSIQAQELVQSASALFAGGSLSEEDKDAVMRALQDAYWDAKKENKKYNSNKKG